MTGDPNNAVVQAPQQAAHASYQVRETSPDDITRHQIWDHQLDDFEKAARPLAVSFGTMFAGAAIGLLPTVADIVGQTPPARSLKAMFEIMVFGGCLAAAIVLGLYARQGYVSTTKLVNAIRNKDARPAKR